jgi:hypothetical protein
MNFRFVSATFRKGILVAAMLVATGQARADKHIVYDLTPALLAIGASGTITTDGALGVLTANDIIDFSIVLHWPGSERTDYDVLMTPATYYIPGPGSTQTFGNDFTADKNGLYWNFGGNDSNLFDIQARSIPPGCSCFLVFQSGMARAVGANYTLAMNISTNYLVAARAHGQGAHLNDLALAADVTDLAVVSDLAAAAPEPSTWAMMLLGFAGLGFAFRQSRRKVSFA